MNKVFYIFILTSFLVSCWGEEKPKPPVQTISNDQLINIHKQLVKAEDMVIKNYISENNLNVKTTGSGLRYVITKTTEGQKVNAKDNVAINYTRDVMLKDSLKTELRNISFSVGQSSEVTSGIDEGVQLLKVGEQATFIVPPHLGYGITGEQNLSIPPKAILVYNVEVISVN